MTDLRTQTDEELGAQTPSALTAEPLPEHRTFRAATLDEAVAIARNELGVEVDLIEAHRVRRGGLGGFFATDLGVEIIAAPRRPEPPAAVISNVAPSVETRPIPRTEGSALDRLIDRADSVDRLASVAMVDHAETGQALAAEPQPAFDELLRAELADVFNDADDMAMTLPEDEDLQTMATTSVSTPLVAPSDLFDAVQASAADVETLAPELAAELAAGIRIKLPADDSVDFDSVLGLDFALEDDMTAGDTARMLADTDFEFDVEFEYDIDNLVAGYNEICFQDDEQLMADVSMVVADELVEPADVVAEMFAGVAEVAEVETELVALVEIQELAEVEEVAEVAELIEAELAAVAELVETEEVAEVETELVALVEIQELAEVEEVAEVAELIEAEVAEVAETEQLAELAERAETKEVAEVAELIEVEAELEEVAEVAEVEELGGVAELADMVAELVGVVSMLVAEASVVPDEKLLVEAELDQVSELDEDEDEDDAVDVAVELDEAADLIGEELEIYGPLAVGAELVHVVEMNDVIELNEAELVGEELEVYGPFAFEALELDVVAAQAVDADLAGEELEVYGPFVFEALELDVVAAQAVDAELIDEELDIYGPLAFEAHEIDVVEAQAVDAELIDEELDIYGPLAFEAHEIDVVEAEAVDAELVDEELDIYGPFAVDSELAVDEDIDVDALLAFCYELDEDAQLVADDQLDTEFNPVDDDEIAAGDEIDANPAFAIDAVMMFDALLAFDEQFGADAELAFSSDLGLEAELDEAFEAFAIAADAPTADLIRPSDPIVVDRNDAIEELDALLRGVGVDPSTVAVGSSTQVVRHEEPAATPIQQVAAIATSQLVESVIALGEQTEQTVAKVSISVTNADGSTVSISTDLGQGIDHG